MSRKVETITNLVVTGVPDKLSKTLGRNNNVSPELAEVIASVLEDTLRKLGGGLERVFSDKIQGKALDKDIRKDLVQDFGDAMATAIARGIHDVIGQSGVDVSAPSRLKGILKEVAEGYSAFTEDDLKAVSEMPLQRSVKKADLTQQALKEQIQREQELRAREEKRAELLRNRGSSSGGGFSSRSRSSR